MTLIGGRFNQISVLPAKIGFRSPRATRTSRIGARSFAASAHVGSWHGRLLRCGISIPAMDAWGQSRPMRSRSHDRDYEVCYPSVRNTLSGLAEMVCKLSALRGEADMRVRGSSLAARGAVSIINKNLISAHTGRRGFRTLGGIR